MNIKEYFERANKYIDSLSDAEFLEALVRAGLNECPYEEEIDILNKVSFSAGPAVYSKSSGMYSNDFKYKMSMEPDPDAKVA